MKFIYVVLTVFIIAACGGKPVAQYAKTTFEEPVLVNVKIDPEDVESGEFIQDELTRTVVNRLNLQITKNVDKAKSYILVNIYAVNTSPSNKDDDGNVIRYSVNAAIKFAMKDRIGFWTKNIVRNEYVSVKAQSLLSQTDKQKAEKLAIKKALDAFVVAVIKRAKEAPKEKLDKKKEGNSILNENDSIINSQDYIDNNSLSVAQKEKEDIEDITLDNNIEKTLEDY